MTLNLSKIYISCLMIFFFGSVQAQKNITISDSLAAHAEKFNVKMGSQGIGKIWKMHFGDYAVISSKMGWHQNSTRSNLFQSNIESKSTEKFSFIFSNKTSDSAWVNAANNVVIKALQEIELFPHFSWGSNELLSESKNFTAFINIDRDTSETWALYVNEQKSRDTESSNEAFLTNGQRKIELSAENSDIKKGNPFFQPAAGYEFFENGYSLCAVQYFGGISLNNNIIWIRRSADPKMELLLAAAMTAIIQLKMNELTTQQQ